VTTTLRVGSLATLAIATLALAGRADGPPPLTVEDAIAMTRLQRSVGLDRAVVAFSPDGSRLAAVVWRGDLARNVNVYTLLAGAAEEGGGAPAPVLSRDFEGDPTDQAASPITDVSVLGDNRTIAFIGREGARPAQVYTVDTETKQVKQLTHHPTAVRGYVMAPDGRLRAYSAVADDPGDGERLARLEQDGVFMTDPEVFPRYRRFMTSAQAIMGPRPSQVRQYFLAGPTPRLIFDSRQSRPRKRPDQSDPKVAVAPLNTLDEENALSGWSSLTADPQGRRALLFPYGLTDHDMQVDRYRYYDTMNAYARRVAAPYGLVDLETGRIERLIDVPHPQFARDGGGPVWSPDGRSVVIHSLLPDDGKAPPQWVEVDLAMRRLTPLAVPSGWRVARWDPREGLVLSRGTSVALMKRRDGGGWGELTETGAAAGFSLYQTVATNGRSVVGVQEAVTTPPELAAYDIASRRVRVLTDLNPELRRRRYGAVEPMRWSHRYEPKAAGFLVKPVDFQAGKRYPLVVLFDDGVLRQEGEPYLIDGTVQLSGHAIQMLAASGFVTLYAREPASLRSVIETAKEGEYIREHVESAVGELDRQGLIDPARVGISGWSRAAYLTDYMLIHSALPFAAASQVDGGTREYTEGMRPFTDEELRRVRTPLLLEAHGPSSLVSQASMTDRLDALGKPVEVLYFATASHSTTRPQHRLRSLGTHLDWWRFWLQGVEDPAPAKAAQYARWRAMRRPAS
jgi:dipeptidyl aminopeptidase/acylaminoacyl peptidase